MAVDESMRDAIQVREAVKHTLGNLSLLTPARNPQVGKLGFDEKRKRLRDSLLKLNQEIASENAWDESSIHRRAARLAPLAISLWPAPDATGKSATT